VSDQGFDFQTPPPRRQPRQFEPPPWEKDQFEALARERAEQERAKREAAFAAAAAAAEQEAREKEASGSEPDVVEPDGRGSAPEEGLVARVELDERQVELMMMGLREEEPPALQAMWLVNLIAGSLVGLVGLALGAWGLAALLNAKLGGAGKLGGMVMVVFGLAFIGIGGWLVYRALRQRGVL
jgi:membrane-bound ClpP family serine protease